MEQTTRKQGSSIIFITRDRFDFYNGLTGNILQFEFQDNTYHDLEITNLEEFENQIKAFIEQNAIAPSNILVVYSAPVLFEKDIMTKDLTAEKIDEATKDFLITIPYESMVTRTISFDGGIRISAGNKSVFEAIKVPFEKSGSIITGVAPYEALGPELAQLAGLDYNSAQAILEKASSVKSHGFSLEEKPGNEREPKIENSPIKRARTGSELDKNSKSQEKEPVDKKRIYIMGGVFGILIIILIFLLLNPPA